jgi:hypothetical protein
LGGAYVDPDEGVEADGVEVCTAELGVWPPQETKRAAKPTEQA